MDTIALRIHHFYDIIRDFGRRTGFTPHPFGHSYHKIAETIWKNPNLRIRVIIENDACTGCMHLNGKSCNDIITHRNDFRLKEEFNNHIDGRILKVCSVNKNEVLSAIDLCMKAKLYLDNILWIYEGNDPDNTQSRKVNVIKGLQIYLDRHKLDS